MLTITLTGEEVATIIMAMLNIKLNDTYNLMYTVLFECKCGMLTNEAVNGIRKREHIELSLDTAGSASWQVALNTISNLAIKDALPLYYKIQEALKSVGSDKQHTDLK